MPQPSRPSNSQVPIANLLRIAFLAGGLLEELDDCAASHDEGKSFDELLQAMLARAAERVRLRGFERGYSHAEEITARPHGRIAISPSIAACTISMRRLACEFDEFGVDTPYNRLLKACARMLVRCDASTEHQDSLRALVREMRDVADVALSRRLLRSLPRSTATRRYRVVRFIARILIDAGQPDERIGEEWARSLERDEKRMRRIFERFTFRFAKLHAPRNVRVRRSKLEWCDARQSQVPTLETDVTIERPGHTRVIECKYTPTMLVQGWRGGATYRPEHLRQLFAYLSRVQARHGPRHRVDGLLLYPALGLPIRNAIFLGDFSCSVATLGLAEPWTTLTARMRAIAFH
ncbi:MAG: hypothetical protein RL591_1484 [Planctomycetota bacterium]